MMKRFFTSMLGSLAAIWISISLFFLLCIFGLAALLANAFVGKEIVKVTDNSILYIDLSTTVAEINPRLDMQSLISGDDENILLLQPAVEALRHAESDPRIKGVYLDLGGVSSGVASLRTLNEALSHFKEHSDKWIVAYGDQITQGSYYLASTANELYINPQGMLDIHGLSASIMFYKGLLEKVGVKVQVLKVGTFKSAVEPYILDSISDANRLQMNAYMGAIWDNLLNTMATLRDIEPERLNGMADSMLLTVSAPQLVERRLVDATHYRHEVEDMLREKIGIDADKRLPLVHITDYYGDIRNNLERKSKNKIVILYATGEITESGRDGIASDRMVPVILDMAQDDEVKGMLLRVNSPGGSAFASEQIWEALETFKDSGKTLYVSMGDVAASGGYYISCGADKIFASPVTLTGSIGIFGLIPEAGGLLKDHLGINVSTVSTNRNGDFPSLTSPMTPFERASMQNYIERGYETFVGRCAQGRGMEVDSIKAIAEGRVWAGVTAKEIGLVDELGDLDDALNGLITTLDLPTYELKVYPNYKTNLFEIFASMGNDITASVLRKVMGEGAYEIYKKAKRLEELDAVQCHMGPVEVSL